MSPPLIVKRPGDPISVRDGDPALEVHKDCVFVPISWCNFWENFEWGVYDRDGRLIDAAAHRTYADMRLTGQSAECPLDLSDVPYAPGERYFYIGNIINHFGHFICSSMARLWALPQIDIGSTPVVGHAGGVLSQWFSWPFTRVLFGAANLTEQDFVEFSTPVRFRELIVANPSFVELNLSYTGGARAAHRWGDRLAKTQDLSRISDVIYFSRANAPKRNGGLGNEAALVEALSARGVTIVSPETLTIPQQIALFRTTKIIIGEIGSAFHTSIFSPPIEQQKLICICHSPQVYGTNHALVDGMNKNNASYLYFESDWRDEHPGLRTQHIRDPLQAAAELLAFAFDDDKSTS